MIRSIALAGILLLSLSACGPAPAEGANDKPLNAPDATGDETAYLIKETQITLRDGKVITCLSLRGYGISCDWHNEIPGD